MPGVEEATPNPPADEPAAEGAAQVIREFLDGHGYRWETEEVEDGLFLFEVAAELEEGAIDFMVLVDFEAQPAAGKVILPLDEQCSSELDRELLLANMEMDAAAFARSRDPEGYLAVSSFLLSELSSAALANSLDGVMAAAAHFYREFYEE